MPKRKTHARRKMPPAKPTAQLRAPSDAEVTAMREANARVVERRERVSVKRDEKTRLGPPHTDLEGWTDQLVSAYGTSSWNFMNVATDQLENAINNTGALDVRSNAALAVMDGARPENEIEAQLVMQMIAAHAGAMKCMGLLHGAQMLNQFEAYGGLANKFMRTYAAQLESLQKLRRGGEQTVRVEHVHVYQGGQAVVGQVSTEGGRPFGIVDQSQASPDGAALSYPPMRGEDAIGNALPLASRGEQTPMPDARCVRGSA